MKVIIELDGEPYEVDLPQETVDALQQIATTYGIDLLGALQQAIVNEKFLEDQEKDGAKLLIEKDNNVRELVRS